jgi:hypothetical protein
LYLNLPASEERFSVKMNIFRVINIDWKGKTLHPSGLEIKTGWEPK